MIRRHSRWALSLALLAVASTVAWFSMRTDARPHSPMKTAELRWSPGNTQHYRLHILSEVRMSTDGRPQEPIAQSVDGVLELHTLSVDGIGAEVGMLISPLQYRIGDSIDAPTSKALSAPIRLRISNEGMLEDFVFSAPLNPLQRDLIKEFLLLFELNLQPEERWESEEAHATGRYLAHYELSGEGGFTKTKLRYLAGPDDGLGDSLPQVLSSTTVIELDSSTDWVSRVTLNETLVLEDGSGLKVEVTTQAELRLLSESTSSLRPDEWNFSPVATVSNSRQQHSPEHVQDLGELEEALAGWVKQLQDGAKGRTASIHAIRDLLLSDDRVASTLLATLQTQALEDRTRADLFLAFELAGTDAAQQALCQVRAANGFSEKDNLRAVIALGGVRTPSITSINTLWELSLNRSSALNEGVANTASLALGSLGNQMRIDGSPKYQEIRDGLLSAAQNARDGQERAALVLAIGNTGDSEFSQELLTLLEDERPNVRRSVASAIGKLGGQEAIAEIAFRISSEPSSAVRASMAKTLASWKAPTTDSMHTVRELLLWEKDELTRLHMARFLGKYRKQHPGNTPVLRKLMETELSEKIRSYVGAALAR